MTLLRRFGLTLLGATMLATPALAQDAPARVVDGEKILQLLVAKGLVSQAEADAIVSQATVPASAPVVAGGVDGDTQTIPYIPETVRKQIKAELRQELAGEAEANGWVKPGETPEWTRRITVSGDIRVRGEGDFFAKGNDPDIVDFNAINQGAPYNINRAVAGSPNPPFLNTTENRNRARIRARLGVTARLTDWISAEVRLGTGNGTAAISTNQTLGGGNGDFSKYAIWLDRAAVRLQPKGALDGFDVVAGRAANPFWTSELAFEEDLNFDGVSLGYRGELARGATAFLTLGAFPTYNTDFNFGSRDAGAFRSRDRWLLAAQGGADLALASKAKLSLALGYFHFSAMKGAPSSPCAVGQDVCDTDESRPLFLQYGNSLYPIRTLIPDPDVAPGLSPEPQYFGLASDFHVLEAHAALDLGYFGGVPVRFEGEYLRNLAFDRGEVIAIQSNVIGDYQPGGSGWAGTLLVGQPTPGKWGEWNLSAGYRRIGTDAMLAGLADNDFHLGGTNAKGYILGGSFGLGGGTSLGARWLSADAITGQPYSVDVLQLDLNARF